jgi:hypothetical protein
MAMRSPDELAAAARTINDDIRRYPPRPHRTRQGPGPATRLLRRILGRTPPPARPARPGCGMTGHPPG